MGNAVLELGFLSIGDKGDFTKPALDFAKDSFKTTELGKNDIKSATLKSYGVVWWHEGDTDPGELSNAEKNSFLDYANSGGAIC